MNKIILMGRLVKDPEVRMTTTQKTVCTFTLAVDRPFKSKNGQREADFINIQTWNKTAELCGNSLRKGHRALVEGRLQIRSYDGKDGAKHCVTEVIADHVEFIEPKRNDAQPSGSSGFEQFGTPTTQPPVMTQEDIPF